MGKKNLKKGWNIKGKNKTLVGVAEKELYVVEGLGIYTDLSLKAVQIELEFGENLVKQFVPVTRNLFLHTLSIV